MNLVAIWTYLQTRFNRDEKGASLVEYVLLVAMIGAIVLTLRHREKTKRQNIADQVARTKATAIEIVKVRSGQGLS